MSATRLQPQVGNRSVIRTMDVFETFGEAKTALSLNEMSERMGLPSSTCHGLLQTLRNQGYLYLATKWRYYPTRRLFDISETILAHDPYLDLLRPQMSDLRDSTRETVLVGKLQGDCAIYLDVLEGLETIRYSEKTGVTKPLHSSAIGKALLGTMLPRDLQKTIERIPLPKITENTIADVDALKAEIESSRQRGYFMTLGENVGDVGAVAVTATVRGEQIAIAVAGPVDRISRNQKSYFEALRSVTQAPEEMQDDV